MTGRDQKPVVKQESSAAKDAPARRARQQNRRSTLLNAKFTGLTKGLKKHIYDIGVSNQTQLFSNTTKEIAEYAGRILKESQDI